MTKMKGLTLVTILVSGMAFASGACANEASPATCFHLARQVSHAISQTAPGTRKQTAKTMAQNAHSFCSAQMYGKGTTLYHKVLSLLSKR